MAYPNTTSQSLHTLKINKVPNEETFAKMQDDNLVNANELYLVEGDVSYPVTSVNGQTGDVEIDIPDADDHKWNNVELNKNGSVTQSNVYIPYLATTTSTSANLISTNNEQTGTNAANKIPKYNNSGYLISTTPTTNDNSTKVATTAFVNSTITSALSGITSISTEIVSTLPSTGVAGRIYFKSNNVGTNDIYEEYIYVNNVWEKLGNFDASSINLSDYLKTTDIADWAKASTKPTYTANEVGALSSNTTYVSSVNGQSGAVTITDSDEKLKTIHSSGNGTYYPIFGNMSSTAETKYYHGNYRYKHSTDMDSLQLGQVSSNSTAKGRLTLCSGPYYTYLDPPLYSSIDDDRTYTLPNTTGTLALESDIHTYTAGHEIDITNDTIGFDGYDVTTTTTTLCNETVTATNPDEEYYASVYLAYSAFIVSNPIKVTFNGIEYICPQSDDGGYSCYGGVTSFNSFDFSEYPFGLVSSGFTNALYTKNTGTYTIKIETITDNITVSSDFAKARGYSIIENPSQVLINESTTTTNSESTYNEGTLSYFSELNDVIKVTFDNVEYICPNNNYVYGASWDTVSGGFDFSTYPFYLEPCNFGDDNYTRIITQTAGTHTVKIENFPTVAVLTDDFKQAIKSSFPGNVMIQGVDYVTAGQKAGSSRGSAATAEGWSTTASGESSHAEGSNTTASGHWSHAEGASTTASGYYSHAEGSNTTASDFWAHAEGSYTTASGASSHAEGNNTTANHKSQHVFGEYNVLDPSTANAQSRGNYVEIVGKGTSTSARSNARTLDWNGNEVLAGKLTVGTGPTANMDVATKQYVDNATSGAGTITGVSVNGTSVATSGVANITSIPASILSGTIPSGVDATTQDSSDNSTKIATTEFVKTAISGLIGPMMFKGTLGTGGTITTLPTAAEANTGFTYKVITDGTYASIAAKVGDLFISNGSAWIIVPSGDETFVPTLTSTSDGQGHVTLGVTVGPMVNGNTMSF